MSGAFPLAVIGAGGFVGARLVEMAALADMPGVVPVLRQPRGLGKIGRLGVGWRRGDASDVASLAEALDGCRSAVNLTAGDGGRMTEDLAAIVEACRRSGVQRLIHTSSAIVYGRVEQPILRDDEPARGPFVSHYAAEKARAEEWLRGLGDIPGLSILTLRPGLIWGPRSPWVVWPAQQMVDGTAYLYDGGRGICNLCHVDNLCRGILAIVRHPDAHSGFFNIADREVVTWKRYYDALAAGMGLRDFAPHALDGTVFRDTWKARLASLRHEPALRALKARLPNPLKVRWRRKLERVAGIGGGAADAVPAPSPDRGMWGLQTTRHALPAGDFHRAFGTAGWLDFETAADRVGGWLRFAGFGADGVESDPWDAS